MLRDSALHKLRTDIDNDIDTTQFVTAHHVPIKSRESTPSFWGFRLARPPATAINISLDIHCTNKKVWRMNSLSDRTVIM